MTKLELILANEKARLIKCFEGNLDLKNKGVISKELYMNNVLFIKNKLGVK